jgi:glucose/arabinose dehydrogenase
MLKRALAALACVASVGAHAQQQPPQPGIAPPALAGEPYLFDTAEQHGIRVTVLAKGFARPFAIEFLPGGDLLIVERGAGLRLLRQATGVARLDDALVEGMPRPTEQVFSLGVQDIALHPDFATNGQFYFTWNEPAPMPEGANPQQRQAWFQLKRARFAGGRVSQVETLFAAEQASYAGGSRVAVGPDGKVWLTPGAPFGAGAQDLATPYGKVLRLNPDGSIPADNPFVGRAGVHPAIYSYGHRDQHGLLVDHQTGAVFNAEHGMNGGDEVNLIRAGANYGWPTHTFSRNYDGTRGSELPAAAGIEQPLVLWWPSIAPSGVMIYRGDRFPAWRGNLFVGSARWGEINHTGSLQRVVFGDDLGELRREALLAPLHKRVRDVAEGPDGLIYVLTDGDENAVLRIEPAELPGG